jgi:hypothetical protein
MRSEACQRTTHRERDLRMPYASTLHQSRAFDTLTTLCALDRELAEIWFGGLCALPSFFRCSFLWRLLARRHSLLGCSSLFRDSGLLCSGFLRYDLLARGRLSGSLSHSGTLGGCTRGGAGLKNLRDVPAKLSDLRNLGTS